MDWYRLTVNGKQRIIKDVRVSDKKSFEAFYRNYFIHCWIDDDGYSYAVCTHPDGGRIVDGYIGNGNLHKAIVECVANILS